MAVSPWHSLHLRRGPALQVKGLLPRSAKTVRPQPLLYGEEMKQDLCYAMLVGFFSNYTADHGLSAWRPMSSRVGTVLRTLVSRLRRRASSIHQGLKMARPHQGTEPRDRSFRLECLRVLRPHSLERELHSLLRLLLHHHPCSSPWWMIVPLLAVHPSLHSTLITLPQAPHLPLIWSTLNNHKPWNHSSIQIIHWWPESRSLNLLMTCSDPGFNNWRQAKPTLSGRWFQIEKLKHNSDNALKIAISGRTPLREKSKIWRVNL